MRPASLSSPMADFIFLAYSNLSVDTASNFFFSNLDIICATFGYTRIIKDLTAHGDCLYLLVGVHEEGDVVILGEDALPAQGALHGLAEVAAVDRVHWGPDNVDGGEPDLGS